MDILGQSALLVAVVSFALGFSIGARDVRNKLFLAFAGLSSLISLWAFAFFLERISGGGSFYRLHLLLNAWLGPAAILFVRVLVRIQNRFSRRTLEVGTLLALALVTVTLRVLYTARRQ